MSEAPSIMQLVNGGGVLALALVVWWELRAMRVSQAAMAADIAVIRSKLAPEDELALAPKKRAPTGPRGYPVDRPWER